MLDKTNYTTRTDLEPEEIQALVWVRTALETGEISARRFQMDTVWEPNDRTKKCGSIGCIGGWACHHMGLSKDATNAWMTGYFKVSAIRNYGSRSTTHALMDVLIGRTTQGVSLRQSRGLYALFYPDNYDVTREQAVRAINNYLGGSDEPWDFIYDPEPGEITYTFRLERELV